MGLKILIFLDTSRSIRYFLAEAWSSKSRHAYTPLAQFVTFLLRHGALNLAFCWTPLFQFALPGYHGAPKATSRDPSRTIRNFSLNHEVLRIVVTEMSIDFTSKWAKS